MNLPVQQLSDQEVSKHNVQSSLDGMTEITDIPKGHKLFAEGETPDVIYFVYTGKVRLFVTRPKGEPMILRNVEPGEVVELGSLFSSLPYQATAEAETNCRVGIITKEKLLRYLREHPESRLPLLRMLSRDVKQHYELMRKFRW